MHLAQPPESTGYVRTRAWLEEYFDRRASAAWAALTSESPVGRIRATVREGRAQMQRTLLDWLPTNLSGMRVLDAGCGTGTASIELARRGAEVVAIDLSPTLVAVARDRAAQSSLRGRVDFRSGDMLDPALGTFDHVIAMDSLIHYEMPDALAALERLAPRVRASIVWTFAPRTPLLAVMHGVGRLLPGRDRAPRIVPMREAAVRGGLQATLGTAGWTAGRTMRVQRGFYTSQGLHLSLTPRRIP